MNSKELSKSIRIQSLNMTNLGNSPHIGSALSIADILGVLYADILNVDAKNPRKQDRDRFILSKGHAGAALYSALAELGFFDAKLLKSHSQNGSVLSGHVSHREVPGVEFSTGSLGHGLPVGVGMAYAAKIENKSHRVFVLMSDGECDEGSNWEAILFAAHHRLTQMTVIIDYNKLQSIAPVSETIGLEPLAKKFESFNWRTVEVDGHDHEKLKLAFQLGFKNEVETSDRPTCVIAHTTKGKGVSFMENKILWHYKPPNLEELAVALAELNVPEGITCELPL